MTLAPFSPKQMKALCWWGKQSPYHDREALICDGAVRSGKTLCMGISFVCWAFSRFSHRSFALCGKTVRSIRRNMVMELLPVLRELGFTVQDRVSQNKITLSQRGRKNTFYLFGGKDEASAALIQGMTLAGVLFDEVALMPRSFVEQACARCSVRDGKIWFSCNPAGPEHWFYKEWICKAREKNALYLRFTMADNPALTSETRARYERLFQGTFYQRYVLGEWVAADGLVYDFFSADDMPPAPEGPFARWRISCDYGTRNPASFGLWGELDGTWYRVREYYYDARAEGRQKTDGEYVRDLARLAGGRCIELVIADPSAASFIEALKREGWTVQKADNQVLKGIRRTAEALKSGRIVICRGCAAAAREFTMYCWEDDGAKDRVKKENDHAMDDIRYFAMALDEDGGSAARFVERASF